MRFVELQTNSAPPHTQPGYEFRRWLCTQTGCMVVDQQLGSPGHRQTGVHWPGQEAFATSTPAAEVIALLQGSPLTQAALIDADDVNFETRRDDDAAEIIGSLVVEWRRAPLTIGEASRLVEGLNSMLARESQLPEPSLVDVLRQDVPREMTIEEERAKFIEVVDDLARYWGTLDARTVQEPVQKRVDGVVHSILTLLDGYNGEVGAFKVIP